MDRVVVRVVDVVDVVIDGGCGYGVWSFYYGVWSMDYGVCGIRGSFGKRNRCAMDWLSAPRRPSFMEYGIWNMEYVMSDGADYTTRQNCCAESGGLGGGVRWKRGGMRNKEKT